MKILIIDDDVKFIQEARNVLEAKNYDVCTNLDIREDIDIDSIESPDLIILKIMMCGCEKCMKLLKKFEKKIKENKTPVIAITDTKRDIFCLRSQIHYVLQDFYGGSSPRLRGTFNRSNFAILP